MKKICFLIVTSAVLSTSFCQVPVITSFTPLKGIPGKQVTINGSNFSAVSNFVFFGTTRGIITFSSSTQINVLVPVGATYSQVSVLNRETELSGISKKYFTPTYAPKKNSITAADFLPKVDFNAFSKPTSIAVGDYNFDYRPEVAIANDVVIGHNGLTQYYGSIAFNNSITGTIDSSSIGNFLYTNTASSSRPQSVQFGNISQSGVVLDYVYACYGSHTVSLNQSGYAVGYGPIDVVVSDIDADGKNDIITANALSFGVSVLRNDAPSGFSTAVDFTTGFQPKALTACDVNGDGLPDLVIANSNNDTTLGLTILKNKSTPGVISFAPPVNFTTGINATDVAAADIDGDGDPDIIVVNQKSNSISVFRNTGKKGNIDATSLTPKVDFATGNFPKSIALGDINGDGKVDIVVANLKGNSISVFQNKAVSGVINPASLSPQVILQMGNNSQPYSVAVSDMDGDGRPDIIVAEYGLSAFAIIKNEPGNNNFNVIGQSMEERAMYYNEANSKNSNSFNASVFPNPAKDYTVLKTENFHGSFNASLLNVSGVSLWQQQNISSGVTTIPLNNLKPGLYFVRLADNFHSATLKLIKQ